MKSHLLCLALLVLVAFPACNSRPFQSPPNPTAKVTLTCRGTAPQEVEDFLCRPVEVQMVVLEGLREITEISREGRADIYIQGEANLDATGFVKRVENRLQLAMPHLPPSAELGKVTNVSGQPIPLPDKIQQVDTLTVHIDRDKVTKLGVAIGAVAEALEKAQTAGRPLTDVSVESVSGEKVLLREFATIKVVRGPDCLVRRWPPSENDPAPSKDGLQSK